MSPVLSMGDKLYVAFAVYYFFVAGTFLRAFWFMIYPPNPPGKIKRKWFIAGFDMWIGAYTKKGNNDSIGKEAYWFPIPFVGVKWWRE